MREEYYEDEDEVLRGVCDKHGEYIGDNIGCPECFKEEIEYDAMMEELGEEIRECSQDPNNPWFSIREEEEKHGRK